MLVIKNLALLQKKSAFSVTSKYSREFITNGARALWDRQGLTV